MAQTSLLVQNSCVIVCGILLMVVFNFKEQLAELYNGWVLVRCPRLCLLTGCFNKVLTESHFLPFLKYKALTLRLKAVTDMDCWFIYDDLSSFYRRAKRL